MSVLYALIALVLFSASAQAQDNPLEKYKWKNRVVLAFLNNSSESEFAKITAIYDEQLKERDILVVTCISPEKSMSPGAGPGMSKCEMLRSAFGITGQESAFLLIGKDGTEKLRQTGTPDFAEIIKAVDQMPMRIIEKEKPE